MSRIITTTVYTLDELSAAARENPVSASADRITVNPV